VAVGRSLVAPTALLEAPQTASVCTVDQLMSAVGSTCSTTATIATAADGGTNANTGAYSALCLVRAAQGSGSGDSISNLVYDMYNAIASDNSSTCLEQCPLCGEPHLNSAAAQISQCWSSEGDHHLLRYVLTTTAVYNSSSSQSNTHMRALQLPQWPHSARKCSKQYQC
jgi:hypothetical protein